MANVISCENYERNWANLSAGNIASKQREALEEHRRSCPYCRNFSAEMLLIRHTLQAIPRLNASLQFAPSLMRQIRQLESAGDRRRWGWEPRLNPVALSAGFAVALLLGFLFLRPVNSPLNLTTSQSADALQGRAEVQSVPIQPAPQRQIMPSADSDLLAAGKVELDTAKHRLPETPGHQQIPIPVEDDLWRLNQASTTSSSP
jgi:hypothetical protein